MAIPADKVRLYPDPIALIRDFKPGGKELVMAARVSGPLKSAFGDKAPEGVAAEPAHLAETRSPAQIIVVADTDLLDDRNWLEHDGPAGGDPGRRQRQPRRQRPGLSGRQRGADQPARPRGDRAAVHQGGRDPARQRGAVSGQGAGAAAAAERPAGQAQLAAASARARTRACSATPSARRSTASAASCSTRAASCATSSSPCARTSSGCATGPGSSTSRPCRCWSRRPPS